MSLKTNALRKARAKGYEWLKFKNVKDDFWKKSVILGVLASLSLLPTGMKNREIAVL